MRRRDKLKQTGVLKTNGSLMNKIFKVYMLLMFVSCVVLMVVFGIRFSSVYNSQARSHMNDVTVAAETGLEERISQIEDADALPITFGGDHGIAYPIISEIAKRHPKRVGVLHIDAHLDNYSAFGDDEYSRCSPFYQLYNDPNMDSTKIVHIGIRGPRNHKEEFANAKKYGATVILAREIKENGWKESIRKAIEIASKDTDLMYITVCSDCLDAASMPQGPQDMCGLTSYELCMMLHEAGLAGAKGMDFVEIYPDTLSYQTAAHDACWATLYYLNGLAERKKNEGEQK